MIKRIIALILSVLLVLPLCAFAEDDELDIVDVIDLSEEESKTIQRKGQKKRMQIMSQTE